MKTWANKIVKLNIIIFILLAWLMFVSCAGGGGNKEFPVNTFSSVDTAMGTIIVQQIYASEDGEYTEDILDIIEDMENDKLSWRVENSEISKINAAAGDDSTVHPSRSLLEMINTCMDVSEASDGAFDITIGDVTRLWNIDAMAGDGAGVDGPLAIPDRRSIDKALQHIGYEKIIINGDEICLPEGMNIDLGAVGKGAALDDICEYLNKKQGICGAVISAGGSIMTYGIKPDKTPWKVGIVDPFDTSGSLGVLTVTGNRYISTSGDYERFVEVGGIRYHHIMDPKTGYPAESGVSSVTIVAENGTLSDALSTACFVLGTEKGMELAGKYGVDALFVQNDGEIVMTEGMKQIFSLSK